MHHILVGENLEAALEQIDDPVERRYLIDEAYAFLCVVPLETVIGELDATVTPD